MIYLFRKRNGSIVATTKESAHSMFSTPSNFITYPPQFLGAVSVADFNAVSAQAEEDVPFEIELLVKKNGEDTLVTLTQAQINEAIENGDKKMEARLVPLMKKRQSRHKELLEELALKADRTKKPPSFSHKIGAISGDVVGDPRQGALKEYVDEQA